MSVALDDYLNRVGFAGDRAPTYETLAALLSAHMIAIPFENLDVLLGQPVRIDLDSVQRKLVQDRRGGYCFEHVTLFAAVLEALGFEVLRHSARVVLFTPRDQSPRAHMFLSVTLPQGRFVVDPGFGGPAPLSPVPLDEESQNHSAASHRMVRKGDVWILRVERDGEPFDAWVSTLETDYPVDFEMANHFTAHHPDSPFVNMMMLSRFTENGRVSVMNRDYTITGSDGSQNGQFADRQAFRAFLHERFGFDLPAVERLKIPAVPEWR